MKIKLLVLLTGTFIAVAYMVGCGGGSGNNNNPACPAGTTWSGSTCITGVGAYGANCTQYAPGTATYNPTLYQQCIQTSGGVGGAQCALYGPGTASYNPVLYQQCIQSSGGIGVTGAYPGATYPGQFAAAAYPGVYPAAVPQIVPLPMAYPINPWMYRQQPGLMFDMNIGF